MCRRPNPVPARLRTMNRFEEKRCQIESTLATIADDLPLLVRDIMTPAPSCITVEATLLDIVRVYQARQFRHLLVTGAHHKVLGVVSDRDVLRFFGPHRPSDEQLSEITAGDVMSTDLVTIGCDATIAKAIDLLLDQGINCLPVESDSRLVGILTTTDLYILLQILLERRPSRVRELVGA